MKLLYFILVVWLLCGYVGAGFAYSFMSYYGVVRAKSAEERREELGTALFTILGGPVTLFVCFFLSGFGQYGCWRSGGKRHDGTDGR